ncbi:DsbA family protein [Isoptericola sp. NPDC019693]|uniref:DsbA family protein n=1 Tax=Isoptericola sp. NPDC019693 TaxID=3364009 RepID=UPI0037B7DEB7
MTHGAPSSRRPAWLFPVIVLVVAGLLTVISLAVRDSSPDEQKAAENPASSDAGGPAADVVEPTQEPLPDMARRDADDPLAAGPTDAPVSLVVYSDYQCPYCASWAAQTQPAMLEYAEAGDLRVEWRDLNVFGTASLTAARAAYAAGLQGHYPEYHDALFADGEHRPAHQLSKKALIDLAAQLGLDADQFASDLDSAEVAAGVEKNVQESMELGIYSTPAFVLGGTPIVGAQPTDVFVGAFEDALARAQG